MSRRQIGYPEQGHAVAGVKVDDCLKPAPFADMGAVRNPPPVNKNSSSKVEIDSTAEIRRSAVTGAMLKASVGFV